MVEIVLNQDLFKFQPLCPCAGVKLLWSILNLNDPNVCNGRWRLSSIKNASRGGVWFPSFKVWELRWVNLHTRTCMQALDKCQNDKAFWNYDTTTTTTEITTNTTTGLRVVSPSRSVHISTDQHVETTNGIWTNAFRCCFVISLAFFAVSFCWFFSVSLLFLQHFYY